MTDKESNSVSLHAMPIDGPKDASNEEKHGELQPGIASSSSTTSPPLPPSPSPSAPPSAPSRQLARSFVRKTVDVLFWTPPSCRWDPVNPPKFGMGLNLIFATAATVTVANLYYNQPVLNMMAETFNVSFERASNVATLMQSGYAGGLLFLCPLGDKVRRRPFILGLVTLTATMWLGLCLTSSFTVFQVLSFLCGFTTVTPQLMTPLVGQLAPPTRKATYMSFVVSGILLGMLVARLLSGIVANYTDWINIYWFAAGIQYLIAGLLFALMPDYPATNPGISYVRVVFDIARLPVRRPLLLQACLVALLVMACFTSFWTTLTFLLASPPYEYPPLTIGLFALLGIVAICAGPLLGWCMTDRFAPWYSALVGLVVTLAGAVVGTAAGRATVAGPVIEALCIDFGLQVVSVANRAAIYKIDEKARNRINTSYMVAAFIGQLMGTSVGNRLYALGGWTWSGGCTVGFIGLSVVVSFIRGPRETGWVGWGGSWSVRMDKPEAEMETTLAGTIDEETGQSLDNEGERR